jgi:hypothetical protein
MKSRLIDGRGGEKTFVLVLDTGDGVGSEI